MTPKELEDLRGKCQAYVDDTGYYCARLSLVYVILAYHRNLFMLRSSEYVECGITNTDQNQACFLDAQNYCMYVTIREILLVSLHSLLILKCGI